MCHIFVYPREPHPSRWKTLCWSHHFWLAFLDLVFRPYSQKNNPNNPHILVVWWGDDTPTIHPFHHRILPWQTRQWIGDDSFVMLIVWWWLLRWRYPWWWSGDVAPMHSYSWIVGWHLGWWWVVDWLLFGCEMDTWLLVVLSVVNHHLLALICLVVSTSPLALLLLLPLHSLRLCLLSEYPCVGDGFFLFGLLLGNVHHMVNWCSCLAVLGDGTL